MNKMSKMLHNETRELLVEAYEKTHDAKAVAEMYGVSKYTVYHIYERKRSTGSVKLLTHQRGRKRLLSDEDKKNIGKCIDDKPDITIEEIRDQLTLSVSYKTVERAILEMGYSLKKKSLHATEQERPRCAGKTYTMERKQNVKRS